MSDFKRFYETGLEEKQAQELDRLRLENARLESLLLFARESAVMLLKYATTNDVSFRDFAQEIVPDMEQIATRSPSTALAEFLGPTIEVLKEAQEQTGMLSNMLPIHLKREIDRLTSVAFIKTISPGRGSE